MPKRPIFTAIFAMIIVVVAGTLSTRRATAQSARTLVGGWIVQSTPINGETTSRMGNSLGFPERDMTFHEDGGIRTGLVAREDAGSNVKPLGVWRIDGNRFSATFQLWCPNEDGP